MTAGRYRSRVSFLHREDADDGFGNRVGQFVPFVTSLPARIEPMRGGEAVQAHKLQSGNLFKVSVKDFTKLAQVTGDFIMRNDRSGQLYNIRYVENPDERERVRCFTVETGVADAQ